MPSKDCLPALLSFIASLLMAGTAISSPASCPYLAPADDARTVCSAAFESAGAALSPDSIMSASGEGVSSESLLEGVGLSLLASGSILADSLTSIVADPGLAGGDALKQSQFAIGYQSVALGVYDLGDAIYAGDMALAESKAAQLAAAMKSTGLWRQDFSGNPVGMAAHVEQIRRLLWQLGDGFEAVVYELEQVMGAAAELSDPQLYDAQSDAVSRLYARGVAGQMPYLWAFQSESELEAAFAIQGVLGGALQRTSQLSSDSSGFVSQLWPCALAHETYELGEAMISFGGDLELSLPEIGMARAAALGGGCYMSCNDDDDCGSCYTGSVGFGTEVLNPDQVRGLTDAIEDLGIILLANEFWGVSHPFEALYQVVEYIIKSGTGHDDGAEMLKAIKGLCAMAQKRFPGLWVQASFGCCHIEDCWDWFPDGGYWLGLVEIVDESWCVFPGSEWMSVPVPPGSFHVSWSTWLMEVNSESISDGDFAAMWRAAHQSADGVVRHWCATTENTRCEGY